MRGSQRDEARRGHFCFLCIDVQDTDTSMSTHAKFESQIVMCCAHVYDQTFVHNVSAISFENVPNAASTTSCVPRLARHSF